jgi:biopolymer transport protein ExbD
MRFKSNRHSGMPEINLVPMMDVLMTVLTFFIIVSMTLNGQVVDVFLPKAEKPGEEEGDKSAAPLVIGLNEDQEILLDNKPASADEMVKQMQAYFKENPEGVVMLKADRSLTYKDVSQLLKQMRDVGGGRVSLGIEL